MKKVLFLANIPSPYRVDFFNELGKYTDLTVLFEKSKSDERDTKWGEVTFRNFKGIVLNGITVAPNKAICLSVCKYLSRKKYDCIICANYSTPTGMIATNYMICHGIDYYIEGDGAFIRNTKSIRDIMKHWIFKNAKGFFSTSKMLDDYFIHYGAKNKIYRYAFSSVYAAEVLKKPITDVEKCKIKKKLEIEEEKVILTVGQFIHRKGFDILLKAAAGLDENVGVYIVGGTPIEIYHEIEKKYKLANIHYVAFQNKEALRDYFMAADIFVFPTREDIWGLVVSEALSMGLPTISTNRCIAALEMINNCKNGKIVNVEDVESLSNAIIDILYSSNICEMQKNAIAVASMYTIEKMVQDHLTVINTSHITN